MKLFSSTSTGKPTHMNAQLHRLVPHLSHTHCPCYILYQCCSQDLFVQDQNGERDLNMGDWAKTNNVGSKSKTSPPNFALHSALHALFYINSQVITFTELILSDSSNIQI